MKLLLLLLVGMAGCEPDEGPEPPASTDGSAAVIDQVSASEVSDGGETDLARTGAFAVDGPVPFTHFDVTVTGGSGATFVVTVYAPTTAGLHPVVIFTSGLLQPALAYVPYARRLASYGIVAVLRDDPGATAQVTDLATDVASLVTGWLPARNADSSSPLVGRLDLTRIGLAGHGRGGQAILLAVEGAARARIVGLVAIDPVDTLAIARGTLGAVGVPSLFIGETLDEVAAPGATGPCAPAADNFEVLFALAPSPSLRITVVGAGQNDFVDATQCVDCALCLPGSAGAAALELAVRASTAFFARVLLHDSSVGATLAGAGLNADVSAGRVTLQSK